jgi:hypothetical protein
VETLMRYRRVSTFGRRLRSHLVSVVPIAAACAGLAASILMVTSTHEPWDPYGPAGFMNYSDYGAYAGEKVRIAGYVAGVVLLLLLIAFLLRRQASLSLVLIGGIAIGSGAYGTDGVTDGLHETQGQEAGWLRVADITSWVLIAAGVTLVLSGVVITVRDWRNSDSPDWRT